jgi:hypothetical protein
MSDSELPNLIQISSTDVKNIGPFAGKMFTIADDNCQASYYLRNIYAHPNLKTGQGTNLNGHTLSFGLHRLCVFSDLSSLVGMGKDNEVEWKGVPLLLDDIQTGIYRRRLTEKKNNLKIRYGNPLQLSGDKNMQADFAKSLKEAVILWNELIQNTGISALSYFPLPLENTLTNFEKTLESAIHIFFPQGQVKLLLWGYSPRMNGTWQPPRAKVVSQTVTTANQELLKYTRKLTKSQHWTFKPCDLIQDTMKKDPLISAYCDGTSAHTRIKSHAHLINSFPDVEIPFH